MEQKSLLDFMNSDEFGQLIDELPLGICIVDDNARVLYWNKTCEKIHGLTKADMVGHLLQKKSPGAKQIEIVEAMKNNDNKEIYYSENYNVIMTVSPIRDPNGKLIGCISVEQDLSTYKKIYQMLEDARDNIEILKKELNKHIVDRYSFDKMIGQNVRFLKQKELCRNFANSKATILLQGESGTGKDVFARAIHTESKRSGAFIAINCSAIPFSIFESELFGYEKGSFTGADKNGKQGFIEAADGGTLFLDEIGEMPLEVQPKLLRVLEEGEITRVGGRKVQKIDVRIICATNRNLKKMAEEKKFRLDLYYRLSTLNVNLIPLRERKDDIPLLAEHFLRYFCGEYNLKFSHLSEEITEKLQKHDWEGNIRELRNCIERMVISMKCCGTTSLMTDNFSELLPAGKNGGFIGIHSTGKPLSTILEDTEKAAIIEAINESGGSITKAANVLQIPRTSLYYKLKKFKISIKKEADV